MHVDNNGFYYQFINFKPNFFQFLSNPKVSKH